MVGSIINCTTPLMVLIVWIVVVHFAHSGSDFYGSVTVYLEIVFVFVIACY